VNTFSERVKHAKLKSMLSATDLSALIGVTPQAIWNYENRAEGGIGSDLLFPLADALGVSARWLATGIGNELSVHDNPIAAGKIERIAKHLAALSEEKLQALSIVLGIKL
jgi:transcriptional regulator with XRE-family HTH domain